MRRLHWMVLIALIVTACASPAAPAPTATPFTGTPRAVIIDTDMGSDDWMAILYLLQRQDIAVRAITVTGTGLSHCEPGVQHALGLAALAGQPDIPVACGSETPLQGSHAFPDDWRAGVDVLMGLRLPENPNGPAAQTALELIGLTAAAGEVSLLALGPLTNVAEALQAQPELAQRLAAVYIMGGAVDVPGNVSDGGTGIDNPHAEWNFYADPAAAQIVLASGAAITLVPLDATNDVPLTADSYNRLTDGPQTPEAQFVADVLTQQRGLIEAGGYFFWDPLAATLLAGEPLAAFESRHLSVITAEGPESGRLVAAPSGPAVRVAVSADQARFEQSFVDVLNARWP